MPYPMQYDEFGRPAFPRFRHISFEEFVEGYERKVKEDEDVGEDAD